MTKHRLDIEYEYDFFLAGISCHEKPYRLCWAINKTLELEMTQSEPLAISLKKNEAASEFPLFVMENTENDTSLFLVANKARPDETIVRTDSGLLVPEQHQADYFFIARGAFNSGDLDRMIRSIREISFVLMAYRIEPGTLKSKQNLLF